MRVTYQACGCIALPDEIVAALKLSTGSVLDISYNADLEMVSIRRASVSDGVAWTALGASCRIRTELK